MRVLMPAPPVMNPWSVDSCGLTFMRYNIAMASAASGTWPTANLAIYIPFSLAEPALVTKMAVYNGAAVSGNMDVGIYDRVGTRLTSSGSVAQATINVAQEVDVTDVLIGPGLFYMAVVFDNTTATLIRLVTAEAGKSAGLYTQASAFALPATATFATYTITYIPVMGVLLNKTLL